MKAVLLHLKKPFLIALLVSGFLHFPPLFSNSHPLNDNELETIQQALARIEQFEEELFQKSENVVLPLVSDGPSITLNSPGSGPLSIVSTRGHHQSPKEWTIIIYLAGDNDLRNFIARNLKQMAQIGSNEHVNIVVHLDVSLAGANKVTRRYYIEKNQIIHVNQNDPSSQCMDSGEPATLISCCNWAIKNYPAEHYALIFWDHGTGILDPQRGRIINPSALFNLNPQTHLLELDRSIGFLELLSCLREYEELTGDPRGICWDDTTGHYLNNQKLMQALEEIHHTVLKGKKFDIIAFDACLMSMLEVGNLIKKYAHIMVGSQEVELGTGWNYDLALQPFATGSATPLELAKNIVEAYRRAYQPITHDFTQSAIDLEKIAYLEESVHAISALLLECLQQQKGNSVKNALRASRNRYNVTSFDEPSYIDLHHFLSNVRSNLMHFHVEATHLVAQLREKIDEALTLIDEVVLANVAGSNLSGARGLSIYFPERGIDQSYPKCPFGKENKWMLFLSNYLYR